MRETMPAQKQGSPIPPRDTTPLLLANCANCDPAYATPVFAELGGGHLEMLSKFWKLKTSVNIYLNWYYHAK